MKQVFLIAALFILLLSCSNTERHAQQRNCERLKRGTFSFRGFFSGNKYEVQRNDSIQIETDLVKRRVYRKRVKWINSCTYELHFIDGQTLDTSREGKIFKFEERTPEKQTITILETTPSYYIYENMITPTKRYKDTMWIIGLVGGYKPLSNILPLK